MDEEQPIKINIDTMTTEPIQEPIQEQPKKDRTKCIVIVIFAILLAICIGVIYSQHIENDNLKSDNLKLQTNAIGLSLCNDGFTKCAAVAGQCKQYIETISNETRFNYNGETNISRMNQSNLPLGPETIYIKVLDDVLFER